jgi:hypothetical protein
MLISDEEHAMMQALADVDGVSVSDYIRLFVRQQYAQRRASLQLTAGAKRTPAKSRRT